MARIKSLSFETNLYRDFTMICSYWDGYDRSIWNMRQLIFFSVRFVDFGVGGSDC